MVYVSVKKKNCDFQKNKKTLKVPKSESVYTKGFPQKLIIDSLLFRV